MRGLSLDDALLVEVVAFEGRLDFMENDFLFLCICGWVARWW